MEYRNLGRSGGQVNFEDDWYNQPWSPYRDWLILKATSTMLMQFMERPDQILKAILIEVKPKLIYQRSWLLILW